MDARNETEETVFATIDAALAKQLDERRAQMRHLAPKRLWALRTLEQNPHLSEALDSVQAPMSDFKAPKQNRTFGQWLRAGLSSWDSCSHGYQWLPYFVKAIVRCTRLLEQELKALRERLNSQGLEIAKLKGLNEANESEIIRLHEQLGYFKASANVANSATSNGGSHAS